MPLKENITIVFYCLIHLFTKSCLISITFSNSLNFPLSQRGASYIFQNALMQIIFIQLLSQYNRVLFE